MITILGATGNIGSKIADELIGKGEKVRVVARTADRMRSFKARGAGIRTGDILDTPFLTKALAGSDAVFVLIPPNVTADDFGAYQDAVGLSIATALKDARVKYAVNLSSVGAELESGTGPITGLHRQEERLNGIRGLNVLHLRAAYFMENLLVQIPLIRSRGVMSSAIQGTLPFPMIATRDIAQRAVHHLLARDFRDASVSYLLGQRDVSLSDAAGVIGKRIGIPELKYVQAGYDEAEQALAAAGLSADMSRLYIEMSRALNEGTVTATRTAENTTATSIEEFAGIFAGIYGQDRAA